MSENSVKREQRTWQFSVRRVKAAPLALFMWSLQCASAIATPSAHALLPKPIRIKTTLKMIVGSFLLFSSISAARSTVASRRRQAADATSEWGRYAKYPAARGRAVISVCLQLAPYWIRQRLARRASRKSEIRSTSGALFADSLLKLGPLYIKLGQILSCRDNLFPPEWIAAMERLQDRVPAMSGQDALELAYAAIGSQERFEEVFSEFDDVPLAAASLGQVHRAVLRQNNDTVAVKVQRRYLRQIYDQDLAFLTKIARTVDRFERGNVGGVSQSWTEIFEDAEEILYREIDYRDEADNGVRFNQDFGLHKGGVAVQPTAKSLDQKYLPSAAPWLRAPYVYRNLTNEHVLVMEYVPSIKITKTAKLDASNVTAEDKEYLADCLARVYLRSFCVNRFFSTDPHPGNLGVELLENKKPRLCMYDFGQACELQPDQSEGILDVIEAIIDMDADRCVDAFEKMGVLKENADREKIRAKVKNNFETGKVTVKRDKLKKRGYKLKTPANTTSNASNATKSKDSEVMGFFTLPAEYAFVARALSQMNGVGKTLDPDFDFISSAAPYIVEIKGAGNYLRDEFTKWVQNLQTQVCKTLGLKEIAS